MKLLEELREELRGLPGMKDIIAKAEADTKQQAAEKFAADGPAFRTTRAKLVADIARLRGEHEKHLATIAKLRAPLDAAEEASRQSYAALAAATGSEHRLVSDTLSAQWAIAPAVYHERRAGFLAELSMEAARNADRQTATNESITARLQAAHAALGKLDECILVGETDPGRIPGLADLPALVQREAPKRSWWS